MAKGLERIYVGGRVIGDVIRLGDCFTASVPGTTNAEDDFERLGRPISMVVCAILTYGKYVNQIHPGMTAELELEPHTDASIKVGEAIVGESELLPFEAGEILGTGDFHVETI